MSVRQAKDMALKGTLSLKTFFVKVPPTRSRCKNAARPPRKYRAQRMTQFGKIVSTKHSCPRPGQSRTITPSSVISPPAIPTLPRQKYLFHFFPNHPGELHDWDYILHILHIQWFTIASGVERQSRWVYSLLLLQERDNKIYTYTSHKISRHRQKRWFHFWDTIPNCGALFSGKQWGLLS